MWKVAATISALICAAGPAWAFDCPVEQMISIRSAVNEVPSGSVSTSFSYKGPYGPAATTWGFPATVPEGRMLLITDIYFQDKLLTPFAKADVALRIQPHPDATPGHYLAQGPMVAPNHRPNYAVLFGIDTLTSVIPSRHYQTPIKMPAGSTISGVFINHSSEPQHMIIGVNGCLISP